MRTRSLVGLVIAVGGAACAADVTNVTDVESDSDSLTTRRFVVVADAHVEAASPSANFGGATTLVADADPEREIFFRVVISGVTAPILSAKLRCYASDGSSDGPAIYRTSAAWNENSITWTNKPAPIGAPLDDKGAVVGGGWVEFDVSGAVKGNGSYDFVLAGTSDDGLYCNAREASSLRPSLIVELGAPSVDAGAPDTSPPIGDAGTDASPTSDGGGALDSGLPLGCGYPLPVRSAPGVTYRVATTGSDSANGTTAPFATLQKAVNVMSPGDEIIVEDGTYAPPDISRSGTSSNRIWIHARNRWGAKLYTSQPSGMHVLPGVSYLTIEGFDFGGMRRNTDSGSAEAVFLEGRDIELRRNRFHDVHGCTSTNNGLVGIYVNGQNNILTGNSFDDIGRWKNEQGCSKQDSWAHDHGVYVSSSGGISNGTVIQNNVFFDIKRGFGVQLYPGSLTNVRVVHNTFAFGNPDHVGQIILGASFSNTEISNNVFYQPNGAAIQVYQFSGSMSVANNLTTASAVTSRSASGLSLAANATGKDPAFVSVTNRDFHLASGSPAIDVAAPSSVALDHDGCSRPRGAGFDVGAYERQ